MQGAIKRYGGSPVQRSTRKPTSNSNSEKDKNRKRTFLHCIYSFSSLLFKGTISVVIFWLMLNLAFGIIDKTLLGGKYTKHIPRISIPGIF